MSQTELHQGTITEIFTNESPTAWAEGFCKMNGAPVLEAPNKNWIDQLHDSFYNEFAIIDGKIYEIKNTKLDPYSDINDYFRTDGNSRTYMFKFNNGGTCLSELIEEAIKKDNLK